MKNKTTAAILGLVLGALGAHWFYLGKKEKGILTILFFWALGIPAFINMIHSLKLLGMSQEEFDNLYNDGFCSDVPTLLNEINENLQASKETNIVSEMPEF